MGCGASASAPYLKKYFAAVEKFAKDEMDRAGADILAMMLDFDKMQKMQAEREARAADFKTQAYSLLEQSFAHHDKSGDGVLDVEESKAFFSNLVDLNSGHTVALARWSTKKAVDAGIKNIQQLAVMNRMMGMRTDTAEMKKTLKEAAKTALQDLDTKMEKAVDAYKADKGNKDQAAFALLDVSKDGKLQKKEFLAAFDVVDGNKSEELLKTLGLDVCSDVKPQQVEMPADCGMQ